MIELSHMVSLHHVKNNLCPCDLTASCYCPVEKQSVRLCATHGPTRMNHMRPRA
jgi:hypothetical protein